MGSRGLRYLLLHRLILGNRIHRAATAAVPPPWTTSTPSGGRTRCSSSGTSFLFDKYADSPENLVELMRRIVRRGGRGRKQDNVPKEVRHQRAVFGMVCCFIWCSWRRLSMFFFFAGWLVQYSQRSPRVDYKTECPCILGGGDMGPAPLRNRASRLLFGA